MIKEVKIVISSFPSSHFSFHASLSFGGEQQLFPSRPQPKCLPSPSLLPFPHCLKHRRVRWFSSQLLPAQHKDKATFSNSNNKYFFSSSKGPSTLTGFFPPKSSLINTVKMITAMETMMPTVRFGCCSAFSMRSCKTNLDFRVHSTKITLKTDNEQNTDDLQLS